MFPNPSDVTTAGVFVTAQHNAAVVPFAPTVPPLSTPKMPAQLLPLNA